MPSFQPMKYLLREREQNPGSLLRRNADHHPEKAAIICADREITFARLDQAVNRFAHVIRRLGYRPGDRIGLYLPQCPEWIEAWMAFFEMGITFVCLNASLSVSEVGIILKDSKPRGIITASPQYRKVISQIRGDLEFLEHVILVGEESIPETLSYYEETRTAPTERLPMVPLGPEDVICLNYSSGTTGTLKGVQQTFLNFDSVSGNMIGVVDMNQEDRPLVIPPLPHFGHVGIVTPAFKMGASVVLVPKFDAPELLRTIARTRATIIYGVPTMYALLLRETFPFVEDIRSLRVCFTAAAPLTEELFHTVEEKFGIPLVNCYGIMEATSGVIGNYPHRHRKPGSIGIPLPGIEVKFIDPTGREADRGTVGELSIRGAAVTKGYIDRPEAWREVYRDGWLLTGDMGYMDGDGDIFLTGRKKDIIICGGNNIFPLEIEQALAMHPGVRECAVLGVQDDIYGEVPVAFVVPSQGPRPTDIDLQEYCRERLARYKVPRRIHFVDAIPKNSAGKVLRRELKNFGQR